MITDIEKQLRNILAANREQLAAIDQILAAKAAEPKPPAQEPPDDTTRPGDYLLTKRELAAKLKIAVRTVENWQRRGILCYIKIGKVVLFHWPDVVAYLKTHFMVSRRTLNIRRAALERTEGKGWAVKP
jgi:hypothetical protein